MRYFNWIFRILLFIVLLGFALKNDQPVTLNYFFGYEWQSPLVVVLLITFAIGTVVGVLAMFMSLLRQNREIASLKRKMRNMEKTAAVDEMQQNQIRSSH